MDHIKNLAGVTLAIEYTYGDGDGDGDVLSIFVTLCLFFENISQSVQDLPRSTLH